MSALFSSLNHSLSSYLHRATDEPVEPAATVPEDEEDERLETPPAGACPPPDLTQPLRPSAHAPHQSTLSYLPAGRLRQSGTHREIHARPVTAA